MASGDDVFSEREREDVSRAVAQAEADSGLHFSVYVGDLGTDARARARLVLGAMGSLAPTSVVVAVDPVLRRVEVVTGEVSGRWLDDRGCALGVVAMTGQFGTGDLAGGLVNGLRTLSEHARHPKVLHADTE